MTLLKELLDTINEALKPSVFRKFVKSWDKKKYEDLFRKYTSDRKGFRIYIPLKGEAKHVDPDPEVETAVKAAGYEIEDYVAGIASKDEGKRKIKIGKLLKDPKLQQKFANDPKRQATKSIDNYVVISRHPYDIAGMSTDRGWKSCMNLKDGINKHYVPIDIAEGSLVAYLIKADDKNINNPMGRVLIKPFINSDKKASPEQKIALGVEERVYGTTMPGFRETVMKWVDEVNDSNKLDGIFQINPKLYNDSTFEIGVGPKSKVLLKLKHDPSHLKDIKDPTPEMIDIAIHHSSGVAITYLKNRPTHEQIKDALHEAASSWRRANVPLQITWWLKENNWLDEQSKEMLRSADPKVYFLLKDTDSNDLVKIIEDMSRGGIDDLFSLFLNASESSTGGFEKEFDINDLDDSVLGALISYNSRFMTIVKKPSEKLIIDAVTKDESVASSIKDNLLTPELIKKMIKANHAVVDYISDDVLDDDLVRHAIHHAGEVGHQHVKYLKNPTEDEAERMVHNRPSSISRVKKPSDKLLMWVAQNHPQYLEEVREVKIPEKVMQEYIKTIGEASWDFIERLGGASKKKLKIEVIEKFKDELSDKVSGIHGLAYETDPDVQMAVFKNAKPSDMGHFGSIDQSVQDAMIEKNPKNFEYITSPSEATALKVVHQFPGAIKHIIDPDPELVDKLVALEPKILRHIKKPTFKQLIAAAKKIPKMMHRMNFDHLTIEQVGKVMLAAAIVIPKDSVDEFAHRLDEWHDRMGKEDIPEKVMLALIKKDPNEIFNLLKRSIKREMVLVAAKGMKTDEEHERLFSMVNTLISGPKKEIAEKNGLNKALLDEIKPIAGQIKKDNKALDKIISDKIKTAKPVILKSGTKNEDEIKLRKEIADYITAHKPVASIPYNVDSWRALTEAAYIKSVIKSALKNLLDPRERLQSTANDPAWKDVINGWTFDTVYWRKQENKMGQIAFYRSGHPVGYYDLRSGKIYWPTKRKVKPVPVFTVSESRTSFKQSLHASYKDEEL